jgi:plastocyanin
MPGPPTFAPCALVAIVLLSTACAQPDPAGRAPAASTAAQAPPSAGPKDNRVVGALSPPVPSSLVVIVLSSREPREWPAPGEKPVMDQISLTFTPDLLLVRTGQPVEFRNSDDTLHNINVRSDDTREQAFNVAIPTGEVYGYTFKHDGFYHVGCDIHPGMSAEIVSASTPFVTSPDENGRFAFDAVPAGSYVIATYAGGKSAQRDLEVKPGVTSVTVAAPGE